MCSSDLYLVAYNIGIYAEGSRRGLEALKPDFTLEDNFDNGAKFPGLRLYPGLRGIVAVRLVDRDHMGQFENALLYAL